MVNRGGTISESQAFTIRPICAAVQSAICAMAMAASASVVQAAPAGGQVVGGTGSISQSGLQTTIKQASQNMAINWQSYNVNTNERVQYIQPNTSSISLNRILSNNGSTIAGRIDANGQVILVNPNGIFFTSTAVINVGGIIASGLDINPDDFMNGNYIFNDVLGKDGAVVNTGTINASLGGNVALIGRQVKNDGVIAANLGTVTLAAGKQAVLTFDNGGILGIRVSKAILQDELGVDPAVVNNGTIQASGGRVLMTASTSQDVFSQAVNTGDIQQATSVVVNADGTFTLGSGADVVNTGTIDTSTTTAEQGPGQIVMLGNNVTSSGILKADAAFGNAGEIELHSTDTTLLTQDSLTSARSETGGIGGFVKVLGDKVGLFDQSKIDVSGVNGGGQALIGGDLHGANAKIQNASRTYVGKGVNLLADALYDGNGGKIINWSNLATWLYGNASAKGGDVSGNGGFIEISGSSLSFDGKINTTAKHGKTGTVLFDPTDIEIINGNNGLNDGLLPSVNGTSPGTFFISEVALEGISSTTDIVLEAMNNITVDDLTTDGILSLSTGSGNSITFTADSNGDGAGNFVMNNQANTIQTDGGSIIISGANIIAGNLSTSSAGNNGGAVKVTASGSVDIASLDTSGGTVTNGLGKTGGSVNIAGNSITMGAVNTNGSNSVGDTNTNFKSGASGAITLDTTAGAGDIQLNGKITANGGNGPSGPNGADGNGGDASLVRIKSARDLTLRNTASISANGGNATTAAFNADGNGGASSGITLSANQDLFVYGSLSANGGNATSSTDSRANGNGGVAGTVSITAGRNLTLSGDVSATGGLAPPTVGNGSAGSNKNINLNGSSGNNIFTISGDPILSGAYVLINGNNGNDTLIHDGTIANNNSWNIGQVFSGFDGINDGYLNYNGNRVYFSDIANLTGGNQADTFNIQSDGSITGLIDGGNSGTTAVSDQLNIASNSTSETIVEFGARTTYDPTRISVNNVEQISATNTNTTSPGTFRVIGPDSAGVWSVDGSTTVKFAPEITTTPTSDQLVSLTGFNTIQGGTAQDTFNVSGGYTGVLDGGSGTSNILNITSSAVTSVLVTLGNAIPTGSTANLFVNNFQTIDASTNGAANTLAVNGGATWYIDTNDHGTVAGATFTNFTNLVGGAGINTFDIHAGVSNISVNDTDLDASSVHVFAGGNVSGTILGGAGTEIITVDAGGLVSKINTGTGLKADTVSLANPGVVTFASTSTNPALTGGSGADNLKVLSSGNNWIFDANDATAGSVSNPNYNPTTPVFFKGFANPSGGGNDVLDYSAVTVPVKLDLNQITGIGSIIGNYGKGTTTITGLDNATNTWTIEPVTVNAATTDGVNDGAVVYGTNSLVFVDVTGLVGGSGAGSRNNFIITAGSAFAGSFAGGVGSANFLNAQPSISNTWTIDATDGGNVQYTLPANTYTTNFANIQNLVSGGADVFNLSINTTNNTIGSLSGYISGTSADTLNVNVDNSTVQVMSALTDAVVPGRLNEFGVGSINSTGANTTLVSANSNNNIWNISGNAQGSLNTSIGFNGFTNLTSGGSNDTFNILAAGTLDGLIDASVGNTTVNVATPNTIIQIAGTNNTPLPVTNPAGTYTIFGVDNLVATGADATLVSANSANNTWQINIANGGTLNANMHFSGFVNLTAGGPSDTFNITTGSVDGLINGNTSGTLNVSANNATVQIAASSNTSIAANPAGTFTVFGFTSLNATGTNGTLTELGTGGNQWNITAADRGNIDNVIYFRGFANLTGGGGNDTFNYNSGGSLSGLIDGGAGANIFFDNSNSDTKIKLYFSDPGTPVTDITSDLHLYRVTTLENKGAGHDTLIAPDTVNAWAITDATPWTLSATDPVSNATVKFTLTGFQNLTGGSNDDTFGITSSLSVEPILGMIDGGGQGVNGDVLNLTVTGAAALTKVKLGAPQNFTAIYSDGLINATGIEKINGSTSGITNANTTLIAADTPNNWIIDSANGGNINNGKPDQVIFTNFAHVVGGNNDDNFLVTYGGLVNFSIDGGDQVLGDTADYSNLAHVDIYYGSVSFNGITGLEGVKGNGFDSTLHGPATQNADWTINGQDSGFIIATGKTLTFTDFNYLVGGTGNDIFTVTGSGALINESTLGAGQVPIPGMIIGGGGNDRLNVNLATVGTSNGLLDYVGSGSDVITINDNSLFYNASYNPAVKVSDAFNTTNDSTNKPAYQQLAYTYSDTAGTNTSLAINYRGVGSVTTNQTVDTLTVSGTGNGTIALGTGLFNVNSNLPVNFSRVSNVTVNAAAGDAIQLNDLSLGGTLSLVNGTVEQISGAMLAANSLLLQNSAQAGTSGQRFNTSIANLDIENAGPVYINQTGNLSMSGLNTANLVNIIADADVVNNAALNSTGILVINATGNITLSGGNALTGQLNLTGNQITVSNNGNTDLGDIQASGLTVNSTGTISDSGAFIVAANADISSSGGDILLDGIGVDFNSIHVGSGRTVKILDQNDIGLVSLNAADVSIISGGRIWDNNAGGMNITAGSVTLSAKDGIGTGTINYNKTKGYSVNTDGAIHTSTANLSVINDNPDITAHKGAVNINNQGNVYVKDMRNNGDIIFTASGNVLLEGKTQGAIDANYRGNQSDPVFPGSVAIFGAGANSIYTNGSGPAVADITAENLIVQNVNEFGTRALPIRLYVHNQLTLIAGSGAYNFPFTSPQDIFTNGDLVAIEGLNGLSGQQLIDIESLGDVDPAIFTEVRNYNHEDVAILLPADQRVSDDDGDCGDNNKKCKRKSVAN